jgi:hypothetical protein
MIDRLARLYSYGNSLPPIELDEVIERGERLAKDDLLNFAIHARRLLTIAEAIHLAPKAQVPTYKFGEEESKIEVIKSNSPVDVWRIINTIVHHDRLFFLNSSFAVRIYTLGKIDEGDFLRSNRDSMLPMIVVASDKVKPFSFELKEFVNIFYDGVVSPLVEFLSSKGVYVEMNIRE